MYVGPNSIFLCTETRTPLTSSWPSGVHNILELYVLALILFRVGLVLSHATMRSYT